MPLIKLTESISYLPAVSAPLSCDIVFIKTDKSTWIFDTGTNEEAAAEINKIDGPKNIVISHFHADHITNIPKINYTNLYVSKNTKKYTKDGIIVSGNMIFDEEPEIKIMELPSSHAKGCLILICGEYAFLGDGAYCKPLLGHHTYNSQLLLEMIKVMESLDVKYFCLSHDKSFVQRKEAVVALYRNIYKRRKADNPIINVEDFFNDDGSVRE